MERICGDTIRLCQLENTIRDISELREPVQQADIIAAVLPLGRMAELLRLAGDKPVLQSVSARIPLEGAGDNGERRFGFVHVRWQRLVRLEYEVMDL